jgi:hypothetical protein
MREYLLSLLKSLHERIPPASRNQHHSITYAATGCDSDGLGEGLALNVWLGSKVQVVFLDDADLQLPPDILASEVAEKVSW